MSTKPFYITTAIDYTNAAPHIGHAYEKVFADVIARHRRLTGDRVFFLTGVDQHGQKVKQAAEREGIAPQAFADRETAHFLALWEKLGVSYDGWAATTDAVHKRCVQKILARLHDQGALYKAKYSGHYSVRQEQFLTEKERDAEGRFGPEWGEVVFIEEENWYFRLSDYREWLAGFLKSRPSFVYPAFRGVELANAVERFTGDLCISRPKSRLSWGIELPFDPDFVTYVWFDALINYVSFAGYLAEEESLPHFAELWPADVHVIGKDILVPAHGVYWPCMLKAMGFLDEQMPRLLVHGWWLRGSKISKSEGNVVDPAQLADRFGVDAVRYYLMRDIATGHDAEFAEERLVLRYNTELANGFGNLLNRTLNMTHRFLGGQLPGTEVSEGFESLARERDEHVHAYSQAMDTFEVQRALESCSQMVSSANAMVDAQAPWKLAKEPESADRLGSVLTFLAETCGAACSMLAPILPSSAAKVADQLRLSPQEIAVPIIPAGHRVAAPEPVFPRIEG